MSNHDNNVETTHTSKKQLDNVFRATACAPGSDRRNTSSCYCKARRSALFTIADGTQTRPTRTRQARVRPLGFVSYRDNTITTWSSFTRNLRMEALNPK